MGVDIKVAYLLNQSMTMIMLPNLSNLGSKVIKSMEILSYEFFGMSKGLSNPLGCLFGT